jgi:uncharacterized protein (DUF2267 family)
MGIDYQGFISTVSDRAQAPAEEAQRARAPRCREAGLDREHAWRATEAVLEVLAYRITAGQVEDLERRLPPELQQALERGKAQRRSARPLSVDTFVGLIAKRESVDRGQAAEHARAVFAVLREAVGGKEFHDTTEQPPPEYRALLRRK